MTTCERAEKPSEIVKRLGACGDESEWLSKYESAETAWSECPRGDWMLWYVGKTVKCPAWSDGRKPLLACCLECAETAKHLWPESQKGKIANAINSLRGWVTNTTSLEEAKKAKSELFAYAAAADDDAYAYAYADAADAAYAAAYAYADDDAEERAVSLKTTADIVRRHYPKPPEVPWQKEEG